MKRYLNPALVVTAALVAGLLVAAGAAAATTTGGPVLEFVSLAPDHGFIRGGPGTSLNASGLQPYTSYTFHSDQLTLDSNGAHSITLTTDATPTLHPIALLPATDPVTDVSVTMTAANDSTVLATLDTPVAHPFLFRIASATVCPGQPVTVYGLSFVAGSYQLQSDTATVSSDPVQAGAGQYSFSTVVTAGSANQFTVTATAVGASTPTASQLFQAKPAYLEAHNSDPWQVVITGACFAPGEQVNLSSVGGLTVPATKTADSYGSFQVTEAYLPGSQPTDLPIRITATGQASHQQQVITPALTRSVLLPGQTLRYDQTWWLSLSYGGDLASSTRGYALDPDRCIAPMVRWTPDGQELVWAALSSSPVGVGGCSLQMQTDGNAVLRSAGGYSIWSTGTHVAGSHLLLTDTGSLQVISPTGAVLWNSSIAPSRVSIASSRYHSAVYINGLVQQRAPTAELIRGAHRTVYLQRYLDGRWQNMLARTTDSQGQLAVGFVQPRVYQYRLVLQPTASAFGATSSSTFR